jgi:haloalkane dehalogenase
LQRGLDRIFDRAPVGQITLIRFNNFRRARTTMPSSLPCRVVWGDRDKFIPVEFAHAFGAKQITIVLDAGHWVALTAPEALALTVEALGQGVDS